MFVMIFIMLSFPMVAIFGLVMVALMGLFCGIIMVVCSHGDLFDTLVRVDNLEIGAGCGYFFQMYLFKFDPYRKIELCFGNGDHLTWLGFIRMRIGPRMNHYLDIHQLLTNLLHKVFLRCDTDKNRNFIFRKPGS